MSLHNLKADIQVQFVANMEQSVSYSLVCQSDRGKKKYSFVENFSSAVRNIKKCARCVTRTNQLHESDLNIFSHSFSNLTYKGNTATCTKKLKFSEANLEKCLF